MIKEQLSNLFEYTGGKLIRKSFVKSDGRVMKAREILNTGKHNGYTLVHVLTNNVILYHRIVWIMHNGEIPAGKFIDHINGIKNDNRIENLRLVTHRENCNNWPMHRNGKLVGCSYDKHKRKWQSQIRINGKKQHLGYFNTEQEAHNAYLATVKKTDKRFTGV